jgi:lycopene cyclase domain-containing protein
MYLYLAVNFFSVLLPLIFSFHPRIRFNEKWSIFLLANIPVALFFILFDSAFTRAGIWGFNSRYISGVTILNLPVEEILFFICIPFASLFTWHVLRTSFPSFRLKTSWINTITITLITVLSIASYIFHEKAYTLYAFLMGAGSLLAAFLVDKKMLSHFYLTFLIILIPFFIVNGILTGTGIEEEVVWYNNSENLGIRMLTIPFEDVFYGLSLLLLNALFMVILEGRKSIK